MERLVITNLQKVFKCPHFTFKTLTFLCYISNPKNAKNGRTIW
jgi:hypothetical protein